MCDRPSACTGTGQVNTHVVEQANEIGELEERVADGVDVVRRGGGEADLGDLGLVLHGGKRNGGDLEAVAVGAVKFGAGAARRDVADGAVEVDDGGVERLLGVGADVVAVVRADQKVA